MIKTCVIIGSGNVAFHITKALHTTDINILQIFGRNKEQTKLIADQFKIPYTINESELNILADIYLICVSDSAISQIAALDKLKNKFLVHLAGSVDINVFKDYTSSFGVMYPLQSFSFFRDLNYKEIPFFIEASTNQLAEELTNFVKNISSNVTEMNGTDRIYLHLAAVIASNFTNHMYAISDQILQEHNLNFDLLRPLIIETAQKVMTNAPIPSQTGPALRNNTNVMAKHTEMLSSHPDWQKIYTFVSNSIYNLSQK